MFILILTSAQLVHRNIRIYRLYWGRVPHFTPRS